MQSVSSEALFDSRRFVLENMSREDIELDKKPFSLRTETTTRGRSTSQHRAPILSTTQESRQSRGERQTVMPDRSFSSIQARSALSRAHNLPPRGKTAMNRLTFILCLMFLIVGSFALSIIGLPSVYLPLRLNLWMGQKITTGKDASQCFSEVEPFLEELHQRLSVVESSLLPLTTIDERVRFLDTTIFRLSRDYTGMQDFALRFSGGRIVEELTSNTSTGRNPAYTAIDDDIQVGRCFRLEGTSGQIGVALSHRVKISHVTVDHIAKELVFSTANAPRNIIVWGVIDSENKHDVVLLRRDLEAILSSLSRHSPPVAATSLFLPLAIFSYDPFGENHIQTYSVLDAVALSNASFDRVVVEVMNNWGSDWTCIYRLRVHGNVV